MIWFKQWRAHLGLGSKVSLDVLSNAIKSYGYGRTLCNGCCKSVFNSARLQVQGKWPSCALDSYNNKMQLFDYMDAKQSHKGGRTGVLRSNSLFPRKNESFTDTLSNYPVWRGTAAPILAPLGEGFGNIRIRLTKTTTFRNGSYYVNAALVVSA